MRPVRLGLSLVAAAVLVGVGWVGWQSWQTSRSLSAAADDAASLQSALDAGDQAGVDRSLASLREHAADADERTSGTTWSVMTHAPVLGDDARGVRAVSSVLHDLTSTGFEQLADSAVDLDRYLPQDGKVPIDSLEELQDPVADANSAFAEADEELSAEDPSGFVGPLQTNYVELADRIGNASSALDTADQALTLLPAMLGGDGPRNYLLVFQNNAEVRATGGLPGAWALVSADNGAIEIKRQGTAGDFTPLQGEKTILPLSPEEEQVYGLQLGQYFQDANFTPDFPRSSELWSAWWQSSTQPDKLDGVLSLDPVAMSYLLAGTGPVKVGNVTLTEDNAVEELLSKPYLNGDNAAQDAFFAEAARSVFTAVTGSPQAPMELLRGLERGADEGRIHLTSFDSGEQEQLAGTAVEGALPRADEGGSTPVVQVTVNDATGSKMSYYLRYRANVDARGCSGDGTQQLLGSMSLNQSIRAAEAATLPTDVTGGGLYGTDPGKQLVIVRVYGPVDGTIADVKLDGAVIDSNPVVLDGRPVALVVAELSGPDDVVLTWTMETGPGQDDDGALDVTPGVVSGSKSSSFRTSC